MACLSKKFFLFFTATAVSVATLSTPKALSFWNSPEGVNPDDFNTSTYQSQSAQEKRDKLWTQIDATRWDELPALDGSGWASLLTNLKAALSLNPTMDFNSDVLPEGRVKFIHAYGVTGQIRFLPAVGSPYTGLFADQSLGIARLSIAADPKNASFTPGMGLKFLIDGKPSLNVLAMPSLDGQEDNQDFFANSFTTHIAEPRNPLLKILSWWFSLTEKEPNKLPVDLLARVTPQGFEVDTPRSPNVLEFVPAPALKESYFPQSSLDYRIPLQKIDQGPLFLVYGKSSLESTKRILMGEIHLESPLVASEFADKKLFFRHMRKKT